MRKRNRNGFVAAVVAAVILGSLAPAPLPAVEVIAHRGASQDAPENTLAAAELAWEQGADVLEIDVHLSRDGRIVLLHDNSTRRTAGHDRKVAHQTLDELRRLDVGAWKGPEWAGERIPTLEEVLAIVPPGKRVFIDLKVGREIVPELARVVRASGLAPEQVAVIGFSLGTLEAVKRALPEVRTYWLVNVRQHPESGAWLPSAENMIRRARRSQVDGLNLKMADMIDRAYVEQVHEAGLGFYVWTVNAEDEAGRLLTARVDGITTDRPAWLRKQSHLAKERDAAIGE